METITVIEAVRRAIDPWGMDGQHTTALRPTAAEVIDRLLAQGYVIVPIKPDPYENPYVTESEQRVLDGNR